MSDDPTGELPKRVASLEAKITTLETRMIVASGTAIAGTLLSQALLDLLERVLPPGFRNEIIDGLLLVLENNREGLPDASKADLDFARARLQALLRPYPTNAPE
jgi:hypothetical protein